MSRHAIDHASITDLAVLEEICELTADAGHDPKPERRYPGLLPAVWLTPYLTQPETTAIVVRDREGGGAKGRVIGYCIAAWDAQSFEERLEELWWPRVRSRFESHVEDFTPADLEVWERIAHPVRTQATWVAQYPAELHLDILPEGQGAGLGRALMGALFEDLRGRGLPGVHLGVDPANTGAQAFYERLGFEVLVPASAGGPVYGMRF